MVARHCVTNSKFLPEKIQMEKYQVGANVYNLDLNVALVHTGLATSQNMGRELGNDPIPQSCLWEFPLSLLLFFLAGCCCSCFLILSWNTSLSWTGQHNSPVCLFSSLAAVALLGPVPCFWLLLPHLPPLSVPSLAPALWWNILESWVWFVLKY